LECGSVISIDDILQKKIHRKNTMDF